LDSAGYPERHPEGRRIRDDGEVRESLVDELEDFVRRGELWDPHELAALIAQSQKRSAVYDAITNPTNVTVEVNEASA